MKILQWFKENYVLIKILIIATILRLYHLSYQSLWLDELLTFTESNPEKTFKESNDIILSQEGTPRLYFFIVKIFNSIFGHTEYNTRLISVLFGLLSVIFIYKLGKKMFNKNVGLYCAIFLTFNLFHIEYSQEARTYSMLVFFVILSFYCLIVFNNKRTYKNALFLGASLGLITNAHPIGMLNVVSVYLVLLYILFIEKESKIDLFKKIFVSGIILIIVFIPSIPTILFVQGFTSFWIMKPNAAFIFQILNQLLGSSIIFTCLFILFYAIFIYKSIQIISKNKGTERSNFLLNIIIINAWIWFEVTVILLKSYLGISITLNRYFIAILPAFILIIAVVIDFIKNNLVKKIVVLLLVTYLAVDVFLVKDFYSVTTKAQFDKVINFINEKNHNNDKIVSRYAWVMSYYINKGNRETIVVDKSLDDFITDINNKAIPTESFWYLDGNSASFDVRPENIKFLEKCYLLKEDIKMYDCWAKHFELKVNQKEENKFVNGEMKLFFKDFNPSYIDENSNLVIFENKIITSSQIKLTKGSYTLVIKGNSYPNPPIKEQNAHLKIKINKNQIGDYFLSENLQTTEKNLPFEIDRTKKVRIQLIYDNDIIENKLDRNVIIYSINIKKLSDKN